MQICTSCRRLLTIGAWQCPDDGGAAEAVDSLPAGARLGQYRIERMLGEGGMGFVYEATHEVLHRRSAIKMLRPELAQHTQIVTRFLNEAKAVNVIDHQNIINVYDYGDQQDGSVYFVMEYLKGETLDDVMRRRWQMAVPLLVHVFEQVGKALAAAHDKQIVHRDLKPANIFVIAREGNPFFIKLLDFGIAQLRGAGAVQGLTLAGSVMGTPQYMSPEQISGGEVDARTDLWAMGVMMYRAATGCPAFAGEELAELADHILHHPPRPARELAVLPAALDQLIAHCLERDPARRCPSAGALLAGLAQVKRELGLDDDAIAAAVHAEAGAPRDGLPTRPPPRSIDRSLPPPPSPRRAPVAPTARRSRAVLGAAIGAAIAIAGGAYAVRARGTAPSPSSSSSSSSPSSSPPSSSPPSSSPPASEPAAMTPAAAEAMLGKAIDGDNLQQAGFAVDGLVAARSTAGVPLLYRALKIDNAQIRSKVGKALCALGLPDAAPKLRAAFASAGRALKVDLAADLMCLHDPDIRATLVDALGEPPGVRVIAARALADAGDSAGRAVLDEVFGSLSHSASWRTAAGGLVALGDAQAKQALAGELSNDDAERAIGAAEILARAGDRAARDLLARVAADREHAARGQAAVALAELGDARAFAAVDDGLAHVEPGSASRRAALAVCGLLPERAGPQRAAIAAIAAIADDGHEDPAARFTAAAALLAQGDHR